MSFSSKDELRDHESLHLIPESMKINNNKPQNNVKPSETQPLPFPCTTPQCNKFYDSIDKLYEHMKNENKLLKQEIDELQLLLKDKLIKHKKDSLRRCDLGPASVLHRGGCQEHESEVTTVRTGQVGPDPH